MSVTVETWAAQDLELGVSTTAKTHPACGTLNCHQISLSTFSLAGASGTAATTEWTPATPIIHGNQVSTTITVPGASLLLNDKVLASFEGMGSGALMISAHVSAANTVTVVVANMSGGNLAVASGTLSVLVFRTR